MHRSNSALTQAVEAGKRGDYRLATRILGELISETDAPAEAWLLLGRSFHVLKDYSRALAAFNDYLRLRPNSAEAYFFAGRTYLATGLPYKAVPLLRKALEYSTSGNAYLISTDIKSTDPKLTGIKSAEAHSAFLQSAEFQSRLRALLGAAYLKSKNSQAAVQMMQDAVEAAPHDRRIYRAYLNCLLVRGIRLCGIEDYELGRQMLRFVLDNSLEAGMPESPILRLELGRAARETGNLREALEHFTAALHLTKDAANRAGDRRIRWARASVLMALGEISEARKEIEEIRHGDSGVPELPWNSELVDLFMIRSLLEDGEWRRASKACHAWLRTKGSAAFVHVLYAEALRNQHDYVSAHNHLQRALKEKPKELDFWYADIMVAWEGEDYKALEKALKTVKSLGGDENIVKRFSVLYQTKTSEDVKSNITQLQDAIQSLGPEPELMYSLGEAYLKVGLLEEAASWFGKTITLKSSHQDAYLGKIAALEAFLAEDENAGRKAEKELASSYKAYLERWPDNLHIRRDMAHFLVKTCEYTKAATELEKLLVFEPSNPSLRKVLAYSYRKTGRYREAALFIKGLLKEKPNDIGLIMEYCGCLERIGAGKYALTILEKARKHFNRPENPSNNLHLSAISLALGILYFRDKRTEKAYDYLREAATLAPRDPQPYEWMAIIARKNGETENCAYYEREARKREKSIQNAK